MGQKINEKARKADIQLEQHILYDCLIDRSNE